MKLNITTYLHLTLAQLNKQDITIIPTISFSISRMR